MVSVNNAVLQLYEFKVNCDVFVRTPIPPPWPHLTFCNIRRNLKQVRLLAFLIRSKQTRFIKLLFNETVQYTYTFSIKLSFFQYRKRQIKATEINKSITYLNCNGSLIEICNIEITAPDIYHTHKLFNIPFYITMSKRGVYLWYLTAFIELKHAFNINCFKMQFPCVAL